MNEPGDSEKWTQAINRGGLILIDDSMYQFLVSVEIEVRNHFNTHNASFNESLKDHAKQGIIQNEDVMFYWAIISVNWDDIESQELLKTIIEHYITVRGVLVCKRFHGEI